MKQKQQEGLVDPTLLEATNNFIKRINSDSELTVAVPATEKSSEEKFEGIIKQIEDYLDSLNFESVNSFEGVASNNPLPAGRQSIIQAHTFQIKDMSITLYLLKDESVFEYRVFRSTKGKPKKEEKQLIDYVKTVQHKERTDIERDVFAQWCATHSGR